MTGRGQSGTEGQLFSIDLIEATDRRRPDFIRFRTKCQSLYIPMAKAIESNRGKKKKRQHLNCLAVRQG